MKQRFKPYKNYQDSGTCYLGEVPSTWEIKQLKRSVEGCVNGAWGQEPADGSDDIVVIRVADFDRPRLGISNVDFTMRAIPEKDRVRRRLRRGDLLLEKSGGGENQQVGQVVLFDSGIEAVTSNFVARLRPLAGVDSNYLNYAFSSLYRDRINTCSIKQNTGIQNLDSNAYLAEQWAFPFPEEQKQIAAFLDYETAKIDALIEKQQQLIALLGEKRQAVISHAVTKGLNPDAPMRDSGIEWLGEVPERWKISRLKFLICEPMMYGANESADQANPDEPRFVRITDIDESGDLRPDTFRSLPLPIARPYLLRDGDVLLARSGGTVGKSFIYSESWGEACFAGYLIKARMKQHECKAKWLYLFCQTAAYWAYVNSSQIQATIQNVSAEKYGNLVIPYPSILEQEEILIVVSDKLSLLDEASFRATEMVELLQERRTALISAAVTGKIDVRGWKPPSFEAKPDTELDVA